MKNSMIAALTAVFIVAVVAVAAYIILADEDKDSGSNNTSVSVVRNTPNVGDYVDVVFVEITTSDWQNGYGTITTRSEVTAIDDSGTLTIRITSLGSDYTSTESTEDFMKELVISDISNLETSTYTLISTSTKTVDTCYGRILCTEYQMYNSEMEYYDYIYADISSGALLLISHTATENDTTSTTVMGISSNMFSSSGSITYDIVDDNYSRNWPTGTATVGTRTSISVGDYYTEYVEMQQTASYNYDLTSRTTTTYTVSNIAEDGTITLTISGYNESSSETTTCTQEEFLWNASASSTYVDELVSSGYTHAGEKTISTSYGNVVCSEYTYTYSNSYGSASESIYIDASSGTHLCTIVEETSSGTTVHIEAYYTSSLHQV